MATHVYYSRKKRKLKEYTPSWKTCKQCGEDQDFEDIIITAANNKIMVKRYCKFCGFFLGFLPLTKLKKVKNVKKFLQDYTDVLY